MCQKDSSKITELICTEVSRGMEHGPGGNPLKFGTNPDCFQ